MPTYEYRCQKGHEFEAFQRMSDEPITSCPTCGERAERLLSGGSGFLFKGSGFYITDYRSDDYKKKASKGESKEGASSSSDSSASTSTSSSDGASSSSEASTASKGDST